MSGQLNIILVKFYVNPLRYGMEIKRSFYLKEMEMQLI